MLTWSARQRPRRSAPSSIWGRAIGRDRAAPAVPRHHRQRAGTGVRPRHSRVEATGTMSAQTAARQGAARRPQAKRSPATRLGMGTGDLTATVNASSQPRLKRSTRSGALATRAGSVRRGKCAEFRRATCRAPPAYPTMRSPIIQVLRPITAIKPDAGAITRHVPLMMQVKPAPAPAISVGQEVAPANASPCN
jgi:hypothetical protein